ncbi:hypothetical protein AVEN_175653-1 [Araneus ventricosus]|uniref:Uncharacterized protein n=1 Tax=Araneus ventricosus TaxID=182803 RepID=A0A4Y2W9B4_ARAVE|nr:hypothetical protein AVEN_58020-1 [Araneus ventricosus]GBO33602.1 hypothetical protein AVEN_175653-1 [Araneus ventricosus]
MIQSGGIQKNLKHKTQSAYSNLRPRCEGNGKTKDLTSLAPRIEARNKTRNPARGEEFSFFEPCLKTEFGTSVNALPNDSTKMGGGKKGLRTNDIDSLKARLKSLTEIKLLYNI